MKKTEEKMMKAIKWTKRILPVLLAVTVGCAAFGGCANETSLSGAEEEPPIVQPEDNKDPALPPVTDPDADEPKDDGGDPDKVPDSDPVVPPATDPDADEPEEEQKELTKEQEDQLIVNNVLEATLEKARKSLGKSTVIHKVLVIDYQTGVDGNIFLLLDNENGMPGKQVECVDLVKIELNNHVSRDSLLNQEISLTKTPELLFRFGKKNIDDSERTQKIYNKLRADGVLEQTSTPLAMAMMETVGGVDTVLKCATNYLNLYTISNEELEVAKLFVKGDSGTKDYVTDYLLNGTLNKHYREVESFYYKFSENAIKDFDNGLTVREI